jgi:ribosomal protein L37E
MNEGAENHCKAIPSPLYHDWKYFIIGYEKNVPFAPRKSKSKPSSASIAGEMLDENTSESKTPSEKRQEIYEMVRQGRLQRGDPEVEAAIKRTVDEQKIEEQREADTQISCPRCGSTQLNTQRKGFGLGKALVGGVLTGGIGLIAGFHGSRKVLITCLKCGNQFYPKNK